MRAIRSVGNITRAEARARRRHTLKGTRHGELQADEGVEAVFASRFGPAHGAAEVVVIGQGDSRHAELRGARDQGFRRGGAIQQ